MKDEENGRADSMRKTWLPELENTNIPYMFFAGGDIAPPHDDVFNVGCPDDYEHLSMKTQAACIKALEWGVDHLFQCYTDTLVIPERLMKSGSWMYPYTGYHGGHPNVVNYASGGPGFWLNRRCMELVANGEGYDWADDRWVGNILAKEGIHCTFDGRYRPKAYDITINDDIISTHLSRGTGNCDPQEMIDKWDSYQKEKAAFQQPVL